ncbi:general secretion pathway protein GspN [Rhodanobacter sp. C01]|nr:general secretion pathway protein GspN [Rhodanobacter sp. C01]
MKYLRNCLIGLAILLLAGVLLLWFLPVRWALPWIEPQLHGLRLQQLQGSLWDGRAGQVLAADGRPLGKLQWTLSRRALFGQTQAKLDFQGPQFDFSGEMRRLPGQKVEWRGVNLHAALAAWPARVNLPYGQPRGELQLTIEHAILQGGWPLQLQAQARWQDAVMRTRNGDVALGDLQGQAQSQNGVIQAQWQDDGHGPLQVDGRLQLSPLGWRLDATLRARQTDPALRHWLSGLGQPDADGKINIQHSGGLAAALPGTTATNQGTKSP